MVRREEKRTMGWDGMVMKVLAVGCGLRLELRYSVACWPVAQAKEKCCVYRWTEGHRYIMCL